MRLTRILFTVSIILLVVLMLVPAGGSVLAQVSSPVLKIDKLDDSAFPTITIYTAMLDAQGFPVQGIKSSDFSLSEDDKPVTDFTVEPIENTDQALAIVIAIDVSGSMGGKPLTDAVEAAKDFNSKLGKNDLVGLISYADDVKVVSDLTTDHDAVNKALDGLVAGGETAMRDAVTAGTDLLKNRSERTAIIVLSDGQDNKSIHSLDEAINAAVRWMTPVYPIGFGTAANKDTIQKLAQGTGGTFQILPDSTTLRESFAAILSVLRNQYKISFQSSFTADAKNHTIHISTLYNGGTYTAEQEFTAHPGTVSLIFTDLHDGDIIRGDVKFSPQIIAPGEVTHLQILLDGALLDDVLQKPFETSWDTTKSEPGVHEFTFIATDNAGNQGEAKLSLEIKAPILITIESPVENAQISGKQTINFTVDHKYDITSLEVKANDISLGTLDPNATSVEWDTGKFQSGIYTLKIIANDANGFSGTASRDVVIVVQRISFIWWVALFALLVAAAIIIPIALRSRKKTRNIVVGPVSITQGAPSLTELVGLAPGTSWPLNLEEVRLGRKRDENEIPLMGMKASRRQAVIRNRGGACTLFSLNPENPAVVNGEPVPQKQLEPGDVINLGESQFRFERRG